MRVKGRVGRSDRKAYAYFLAPSISSLTEDARKRLEVLSRLTDLGSGFKLATADLQIRGAGTLFGEKQSGHIADIGLEFYLELLRDTIESKRRGEDQVREIRPEIKTRDDAFIPEHYIQSGSERLFYYKKWTKLRNGYGVRVTSLNPPPDKGEYVTVRVRKRSGEETTETVRIIWKGKDKRSGEIISLGVPEKKSGHRHSGPRECAECGELIKSRDQRCWEIGGYCQA